MAAHSALERKTGPVYRRSSPGDGDAGRGRLNPHRRSSQAKCAPQGITASTQPNRHRTCLSSAHSHIRYQVSFTHHALIHAAGGEEEARARFEKMILALVRIQHPTVRNLRPAPGDWGIDAFVGELDDQISVWQAKFFINEIGSAQKRQIREAFDQLMSKATEEGFTVHFWTLCIPIQMSPAETKWFDTWRRGKQREHAGLTIPPAWDRDKVSALLFSPEGAGARREFLNLEAEPKLRALVEPPAEKQFDEMLFIKQLRAARIIELTAPKREFFNAELLAREVQEKAVPDEMRELVAERMDVHSIWSVAFNSACGNDPSAVLLPALYDRVMTELRATHAARNPPPLGMRPVHRLGTMHQVVDTGEAGWRRDFDEITKVHREDT